MESAQYLENLLGSYTGAFDVERPYEIGGKIFDAYGYFYSMSEKYVLVEKANLWTTKTYEHVLFLCKDELTLEDLQETEAMMRDHMDPELVCRGGKYPEKDHMMTFLSIVFLIKKEPDEETLKALKKFKFVRNYLFTVRGRSEAHLAAVNTESGAVYTNRAADYMQEVFLQAFNA